MFFINSTLFGIGHVPINNKLQSRAVRNSLKKQDIFMHSVTEIICYILAISTSSL